MTSRCAQRPCGTRRRRCRRGRLAGGLDGWRAARTRGNAAPRARRRTIQLPIGHAQPLLCAARPVRATIFIRGQVTDAGRMHSGNVRRDFRKVVDAAGLTGKEWAPRELRHSFVSLLSDARVPIESISRLVGHRSTMVTETVYRKQLRPVIEDGAEVMDRILPAWPPRER